MSSATLSAVRPSYGCTRGHKTDERLNSGEARNPEDWCPFLGIEQGGRNSERPPDKAQVQAQALDLQAAEGRVAEEPYGTPNCEAAGCRAPPSGGRR